MKVLLGVYPIVPFPVAGSKSAADLPVATKVHIGLISSPPLPVALTVS